MASLKMQHSKYVAKNRWHELFKFIPPEYFDIFRDQTVCTVEKEQDLKNINALYELKPADLFE